MITRVARRVHRWTVPIGFLLPLALMGPLWIYCRATRGYPSPHTEVALLPLFAFMALIPAGLWNLVPFFVYWRLGKAGLAAYGAGGVERMDRHVTGIVGAGLALLGAAIVIHAELWLSVFAATRLPLTQLALGYMLVSFVLVGVIFAGYVVGWIAGQLRYANFARSSRR